MWLPFFYSARIFSNSLQYRCLYPTHTLLTLSQLQLRAIGTLSGFLAAVEKNLAELQHFLPLIPMIYDVSIIPLLVSFVFLFILSSVSSQFLTSLLTDGKFEDVNRIMQSLLDILPVCPSLFEGNDIKYCQLLVHIADTCTTTIVASDEQTNSAQAEHSGETASRALPPAMIESLCRLRQSTYELLKSFASSFPKSLRKNVGTEQDWGVKLFQVLATELLTFQEGRLWADADFVCDHFYFPPPHSHFSHRRWMTIHGMSSRSAAQPSLTSP